MWNIFSCSIQGSDHITKKLPCQDSSSYRIISEKDMVVACVCDGAGSASNSQDGSKFCSEYVVSELSKKFENWNKKNWPNGEEWKSVAKDLFQSVRKALNEHAKQKNVSFDSLSTTVIVVVACNEHIVCMHIGDGRGAFLSEDNLWMSLFMPTYGSQAGTTVFITDDNWMDYYEVTSLDMKPLAFAIMSDGCESACFEHYTKSEKYDFYFDYNRPFPGFFEPMYEWLLGNKNPETIYEDYCQVIKNGTEILRNEKDDKTMLFGIVV